MDVELVVRTAVAIVAEGRLNASVVDMNAVLALADALPNEPCIGLDSLQLVELVVRLEDITGVELPDDIDTSAVRTVHDLVHLVSLTSEANAAVQKESSAEVG